MVERKNSLSAEEQIDSIKLALSGEVQDRDSFLALADDLIDSFNELMKAEETKKLSHDVNNRLGIIAMQIAIAKKAWPQFNSDEFLLNLCRLEWLYEGVCFYQRPEDFSPIEPQYVQELLADMEGFLEMDRHITIQIKDNFSDLQCKVVPGYIFNLIRNCNKNAQEQLK